MSSSPQHNELSGQAHAVAQFRDLHGPLYLIGAHSDGPPSRRTRRRLKAAFGAGASHRRIGLWGPQASGKTCFLTALNVATAQALPPWAMAGTNDDSRTFLTRATAELVGGRNFPAGTSLSLHLYDWLLTADLPIEQRRLFRRASRVLRAEVNLNILDASGESLTPNAERPDVLAYLANCDGLVYFFDPLTRFPEHASHMVLSTLDRLEGLCRNRSGDGRWQLPHRLSVCVAKADEPAVLAAARRAGLLTTIAGPGGHPVPAVRPADGERFFDYLCDSSPHGGGALIRHAIKRYFRPERVRYFTTSSIGFYHSGTPDDLYNVVKEQNGLNQLRGTIRPFNVLEPLLWLQLTD